MYTMDKLERCTRGLCTLLILCSITVNSSQAAPRYLHKDNTSDTFSYSETSTVSYDENRVASATEVGEQTASEVITSTATFEDITSTLSNEEATSGLFIEESTIGSFDQQNTGNSALEQTNSSLFAEETTRTSNLEETSRNPWVDETSSDILNQRTTNNPSFDEQATSASSASEARPTFAPYLSVVTLPPPESARAILSPYERSLWNYRPGLDPIPNPEMADLVPSQEPPTWTPPPQTNIRSTRRSLEGFPLLPNNNPFRRRGQSGNINSNYVDSEEDFQRILDRLHNEAEAERIGDDRNNYVDDDEDIESILRRISEHERSATVTIPSIYRRMTSPAPRTTHNAQVTTVSSYSFDESASFNDESTDKSDTEEEEEGEKCSICLESIKYPSGVSLRCDHNFHENCITRWLAHWITGRAQKEPKCPVCRRPVNM